MRFSVSGIDYESWWGGLLLAQRVGDPQRTARIGLSEPELVD
jgi:hypothetical protein